MVLSPSAAPEIPGASGSPGFPGPARTLHAGEVVETRWTGTPAAAEEVELLLSLDDGRTPSLRITPSLLPESGSYSWQVPPLPAARARLALRAGLDGREVVSGWSAPFRIAADAPVHGWSVAVRNGELWLGGPADAAPPWEDQDLVLAAQPPRLDPRWSGTARLALVCRPRVRLAGSGPAAGRHGCRDGGAEPRPARGGVAAPPAVECPLRI